MTKFDKNLQTVIDDMVETMRDAPGVGLAAPQIGLSERLIVVEYYEKREDEEMRRCAQKGVGDVESLKLSKPPRRS